MYSALIENNGDMKFHAKTKNYSLVMALDGEGANPIDTVVAGLCGCVGHYVRDFFTERKIACAGFTLRGEAEQTADSLRLSRIELFLDVQGVRLEKQEEEALLKHVGKCKVHNTLKAGCDIKMVLV